MNRPGRMNAKALLIFMITLVLFAPLASARLEQEQLMLENEIQQRIEGILAKTLPANSYLVTVKVEMENRPIPQSVNNRQNRRTPNNPFLDRSQFMLPGVPQKKEFIQPPVTEANDTNITLATAETLIRKIGISILVSPDVTSSQIRGMRDIISSSIPFNPLRGDEMEIKPSSLLKRATDPGPSAAGASAVNVPNLPDVQAQPPVPSGLFASIFGERPSGGLLVLLGAAAMMLIIFIAFLFGPVRAFMNRLLAVLPRVGEQAAYAVSNSANKNAGNTSGPVSTTVVNGTMNGHGNGSDLPFHFIREEQLNKLPILIRQMPPMQSALVLAYLAPEWASRVMAMLDSELQTSIMQELSQAREVPSEAVKEIEAQIKSKLPYLVGGVDWVQSVYQLTQPETQRTLLGSLGQQSPALAHSLRQKTFFFEDINVLVPAGLRLLVQESGYAATALALKDEPPEFRETILRKLPAATREIIQQELDLSSDDKAASNEAKNRVVVLARRMLGEGRIALPERKSA